MLLVVFEVAASPLRESAEFEVGRAEVEATDEVGIVRAEVIVVGAREWPGRRAWVGVLSGDAGSRGFLSGDDRSRGLVLNEGG